MATTHHIRLQRLLSSNTFPHHGQGYETDRKREVRGTTTFTVNLTGEDGLSADIPIVASRNTLASCE
jgi:hypothetical protein